ncbi:hypothetical protein [Chryseobacterium artocarpi]|uniref:hypothetical protein n=1 Tax=Chryseobacterium artocarpi TaxID=1414727 RepID=UPI003F3A0C45
MTEDLTHLCICPVCGAPDCGAEYTLWTESGGKKKSLIFGGNSFGSYLNYWYYEGISFCEYQKLPVFVKEYTEYKGWRDNAFTEIDAYDFLRALEAIKHSEKSDQDFKEHYYPVFKRFVEGCVQNGAPLFIEIC